MTAGIPGGCLPVCSRITGDARTWWFWGWRAAVCPWPTRSREPSVLRSMASWSASLVYAGMRSAAIKALRQHRPASIVVAVPEAPQSTCQELAAIVDEVDCATTPSPFLAVGRSYWDFTQTTDEEVRDLLRAAATTAAPTGTPCLTKVGIIRSAALPTENGVPSDDVLFDLVGDATVVLLGEASHGTRDLPRPRRSPGV